MAEKTINIGGRLHSTATGNVVAAANEVFDYTKNKNQEEINADTYSKEETYNKNELNNLITTPDVQHITVPTFGSLPASGSADTIYRVSNWDGGATPPAVDASKYSEYGWDGSRYVLLSVKSAVDEVFDVSVFNAESGVAKAYETLNAALGGVPANRKKGGMSIKFIQTTPATYNVVKTEGVTELPTGTLLDSASSIASGTYTASQLTDFSTLPTTGAATYYVAVTEDETTTYTTWVITLASAESQEYVQYRLMKTAWSNVVSDWQGVDKEPTAGSRNLVESGGVELGKAKNALYGTSLVDLPLFDKWLKNDGTFAAGKHSFVPVKSGDEVKIKIGNTILHFAFVKSVGGSSPDLCDDTSVIVLTNENNSYSGTAPSDAKYLLIDRVINIANRTSYIQSLTINGYDIVTGLYKNFEKISKHIDEKIAAEKMSMFVAYETNVSTTRLKVPASERKTGMTICYNNGTNWVIEQFTRTINSASITNSIWTNDSYWKNIATIDDVGNIIGGSGKNIANTITWNSGRIMTDGTINDTGNFLYSNPIEAKKGDIIYVVCTAVATKNVCPVSKVTGSGTDEDPYVYTPLFVKTKNWSMYAYIIEKDENIALTINSTSGYNVNYFNSEVFGDIVNKLADIKSSIQGLSVQVNKDIAAVSESIEAIGDMELVLMNSLDFSYGSIDMTNGSDTTSNNTVRCNDYIYVGSAFLVRFKQTNGYRTRIYYYDKNKELLSYDDMSLETTIEFLVNNRIDRYRIKYIRFVSRDSTQSTSVTPESVAENVKLYIGSLNAHYINPSIKSNRLITGLAHQGVGLGANQAGVWMNNGQNLLSSYYGAYIQGCEGCLINTVWTSDGVPVCNHDGNFVDAVSGDTIVISQVTAAELKTHPIITNGETVPLLDDALYLCKTLGMKVFLVNMSISQSMIETVYDLVAKYQMRDDVTWMTNAESAQYILAKYDRSNLALCQTPIAGTGSTDYSVISDIITVATGIVNNNPNCKVTLWVTAEHPIENIVSANIILPTRVELGTFNASTVNSMVSLIPYIKTISSHSRSVGSINNYILNSLAEKYPEIIARDFGKEII